MDSTFEQTMRRVISAMYERVGDELTVDDLARTARYSKFHFSRLFRQVTGVSPGRFLSALRFQEAKRLLAATSLSVAEISNQVGYSSLGTFSTRFKRFVGVSPTEYRRNQADWPTALAATGRSVRATATLTGQVRPSAVVGECGQTLVALFPDPLPHGPPVKYALLPEPGRYTLTDVPEGTWYLLAHGVYRDGEAEPDPPRSYVDGESLAASLGRIGPIRVRGGTAITLPELSLRPMGAVDLPVLCAPFAARPGELRQAGTAPPRPLAAAGTGARR